VTRNEPLSFFYYYILRTSRKTNKVIRKISKYIKYDKITSTALRSAIFICENTNCVFEHYQNSGKKYKYSLNNNNNNNNKYKIKLYLTPYMPKLRIISYDS